MFEIDDKELEALLSKIERSDPRDGELPLVDPANILWRQVHPFFVTDGVAALDAFIEVQQVVQSDGFVGTPAAKYEVSTCMESEIGAQEAYEDHIARIDKKGENLKSYGTFGVTVSDVKSGHALAIDDSALQQGDNPVKGHAYIDLRGMPKRLQRRARAILADAATKRGVQYPSSAK